MGDAPWWSLRCRHLLWLYCLYSVILYFLLFFSFLLHSDLFLLPFHFFCTLLSFYFCFSFSSHQIYLWYICITTLLSFPYSSPVLHLCCIRLAQSCSACRFYGIHLHCFINCFIVLSLLLVHIKQSSSGLAVWLWDSDWILEWTGLFSLPRLPRHHSNRWRFDYRVDVPIYCHLCPSALHHVSVK